MIKFYAIALVLGVVGLIAVILGGTLAENVGRENRDPGVMLGDKGRMALGALLGFGMAGLASEYSPLDFSWQVSLLLALAAAALSAIWVRYSVRRSRT